MTLGPLWTRPFATLAGRTTRRFLSEPSAARGGERPKPGRPSATTAPSPTSSPRCSRPPTHSRRPGLAILPGSHDCLRAGTHLLMNTVHPRDVLWQKLLRHLGNHGVVRVTDIGDPRAGRLRYQLVGVHDRETGVPGEPLDDLGVRDWIGILGRPVGSGAHQRVSVLEPGPVP